MTDKQFEQIECLSKKLWGDINNGYEYSMVTYTEFLGIVTEVWERLQEEPVSEDLGEYINELSKQFPEVSFAKLSRIAVRVAKWKEEQMIREAINGIARPDDNEIWCNLKSFNFKDGDKVKVIIIKED